MIKKVYAIQVFSNGSFYFSNITVINAYKKLDIYENDFKNFKWYNKKKHLLKNIFEYEKLKYRGKFFDKTPV